MDLAVILCGVVGVLYVAVCLGRWLTWWDLVGDLAVPPLRPGFANLVWGNPSAVMTIEVLLWSSAVARLGWGTRGRRVTVILLTLLMLAVAVLSGSRAGWLGFGIAVVAIAVVLGLMSGTRTRLLAAMRRPATLVGAVAVGMVGLVTAVALGPAITGRVTSGGEELRTTFYAAALGMGADAPFAGLGPGMWVAERIAYTGAGTPDYYIPHAHNVYLQTFAELGIVGLAAGLVAILCLVWLFAGAIRDEDQTRRRVGWCALFATVYFGAHQLLDFYPNMPAALFAFALPIAWLDATSDRSIVALRPMRAPGRATAIGLLVACVVAAGTLAWYESSAWRLSSAVAAADEGDWGRAFASATLAAGQDPAMPANQFVLGLAAANTGDLPAAARAFQASAAADDLPVAWLDLAAVQAASGDEAAARVSLRNALRLGDQQAAVAFAAGDLLLRLGDVSAAHDAFVTAIRLAPSLAGDPHWASSPAVAALWPTILQDALASMPGEQGFDAALSAGDVEQARAIASDIADPGFRELALMVIAAWTGDGPAYSDLAARAASMPRDIPTVVWAGRVAARRGDDRDAERYRAWAEILVGGLGATVREIRVGGPAVTAADDVAGISGLYYGHYTYRRPTPANQLVPDLPHLVYQIGSLRLTSPPAAATASG